MDCCICRGRQALSAFWSTRGLSFSTADLYDYFEPLLKKEPYASEIHKLWRLAESALRRVEGNVLGAKIIKVLALIYLVEQFDKLPPTVNIVIDAFRCSGHDEKAVSEMLVELKEKECVVYLKRSNQHLRIKEHSGVDIQASVAAFLEKNRAVLTVQDILNHSAFEICFYPVRYNDENDITRYFDFTFISGAEVLAVADWTARLDNTRADGILYAVVPSNAKEMADVRTVVRGIRHPRLLFAIPERFVSLKPMFRIGLCGAKGTDRRYDPVCRKRIMDDLSDIVGMFVAGYTAGRGDMAFNLENNSARVNATVRSYRNL